MPNFRQGRDSLANNWSITGGADPFAFRRYSLGVEILRQRTQHFVKRIFAVCPLGGRGLGLLFRLFINSDLSIQFLKKIDAYHRNMYEIVV